MINRQCPAPRGKGIGGTTIISGLRYSRGNREDYNYWASMGNPGWSYKKVLPYFKLTENASGIQGDYGYHGYEGPMHVEYYEPYSPHLKLIIDGNKELGVSEVDYNGSRQLGVSRAQLNSINGRRISSGKAFIDPILKKRNVNVLRKAYVVKLIIDKRTKEVEGVIFSNKTRLYRVKARREVILSAGAISTPQILMLSGIGPAGHLKQVGIEVIQDLAVGDNLADHPCSYGMYLNTNLTVTKKSFKEYIKDYLSGLGLYTLAVGTEGLGYYKSDPDPKKIKPDLEVYFQPPDPAVVVPGLNLYTNETSAAYNQNFNENSSIQINLINLNPVSRGTVRLKSKDPYAFPLIDIKLLSQPEDIEVLYFGVKLMMNLTQTDALRKINATIGRIDLPACKDFKYSSFEYWNCTIRHFTTLEHHMFGTCQMGPDPSKGAVVDSNLKVHGVKKLRVVDASIIMLYSGHNSAVSTMIAEKISYLIKRQNGVQQLDAIKQRQQ